MPGAHGLADHHLGAQFPEQIEVEIRLAAVYVQVGTLHGSQGGCRIVIDLPPPGVEDQILGHFGEALGHGSDPVGIVGGQVGDLQELVECIPESGAALVHQMGVGAVVGLVPSGDVAGRVEACHGPNQLGMAGGR